MQLETLIAALSRPETYPDRPRTAIEVRQTHISAVFLVDDLVYKLKKPVQLGFLDFSTLAQRAHYCREEVRLNRRLAPHVYLEVVPILQTATGLRVAACGGGADEAQAGAVVDWLVKMRRLPEAATLEQRLQAGQDLRVEIDRLAERLAEFHSSSAGGDEIARFGRFEHVSRNLRENFEVTAAHVGETCTAEVFARVRALTEAALSEWHPLIDARAARGVPRDTHGDLHLDHIYLRPEPPPQDLVIIDCIEFNDRFRYTDPVADMAFVVMDLQFHGAHALARRFAAAYFAASGDREGQQLLPLYVAYRAAVRAKVDGLKMQEPEVPSAERAHARQQGRAHWLLALSSLEAPADRPCLLLVGGLPGSGKSTVARELAAAAGFEVIRSDVVRKELAGLAPADCGAAGYQQGLYTREWTDRTYAECLRRAEELLWTGKRVIVDASFVEEARRRTFLEAAVRWGVRGVFVECRAEPEVIRQRLEQRRGDASDADWNVFQQATARWEPPGRSTAEATAVLVTDGTPAEVTQRAAEQLRAWELL